MIEIKKRCSTHNTTALAGRRIQYIVVHYTAGVTSKAGSAANTAAYFASTPNEASADFVVDDATIVQYNPDVKNRYCWHCGGSKFDTKGGALYWQVSNKNSIGIEICSTNSTGSVTRPNDKNWSFTQAALDKAAELIRSLMAEYGIGADHVIRHYDVNGKLCPGVRGWNADSGDESQWAAFKRTLTEEVIDMTKDEVVKLIDERIHAALEGAGTQPSKWATEEVAEAVAAGITDGSRPQGYAKREEVAAMVLRSKKAE